MEAYSVKHTYEGEWNPKDPKLTSVPLRPDLPPMPAVSNEVRSLVITPTLRPAPHARRQQRGRPHVL